MNLAVLDKLKKILTVSVQKEGIEQHIIEDFQLYPHGWARKNTWLCKSRDFCVQ